MTINLSNSLAGLSLLTGSNAFVGLGYGMTIESRAVRNAKAQFNTPAVTPPWKESGGSLSDSLQISAIRRLSTIIDKPSTRGLPVDVATAFTAYKALDRLRMLAEAAAKPTAPASHRTSLQATFAKGLADLQSFLGKAPSDLVNLSFTQPTRRAESVAMKAGDQLRVAAPGIVAERAAPVPGLTGAEQFKLTLTKSSGSDVITVDLSQTPQPPTLDSIAEAFNTAIAAIPMRNPDGTLALDADGNVRQKWAAKFEADKSTGSWGLALDTGGAEVSIDQVGAGDSLIVASGHTALDAPTSARITRFDDPTGALVQNTLITVAATDRLATERAAMLAPAAGGTGAASEAPKVALAATQPGAVATDANGFTYMVGTTAGDLGSNRSTGGEDLFLTKIDSEGRVIWQRTLGAAGTSQGAAVSIAGNGDVVVAGTVTGNFDGADSDGDMLVARFDADGDEQFATLVRAAGKDSAQAVAVGADGSIFVGGRAATGGGDGYITRLDGQGRILERRTIDSGGADGVKALAVDQDGSLLALTGESGTARLRRLDGQSLVTELGSVDLGSTDARALAIDANGDIAVVGATLAPLSGTQINAPTGGRDGFVARIDSALSSAQISYVGSGADDQIDSVTFLGGTIYVGGRTAGDLSGSRRGSVDGFVARIDAASGAVQATNQFGQPAMRTEPVRVAVARGADNALGALGLSRGAINPVVSAKLVAQTSLRGGDEFSVRVDGGAARKIVIAEDETLATLSDKLRRITGSRITITTPKVEDDRVLRIEAKAGHEIELIAGNSGRDALAKLGLAPSRVSATAPPDGNASVVRPGGNFGLGLTHALDIGTGAGATQALGRIKSALSMTQTAFRSLYWDSTKAAMVDGSGRSGGHVSPYLQAQASRYQDALSRLSGFTTTTNMGF